MMPRRTWNDPWSRYPPSVPLRTTDGIATSKQRGAMRHMVVVALVEVLESYGPGVRMPGRRYARTGPCYVARVSADDSRPVQCSRPTPTP